MAITFARSKPAEDIVGSANGAVVFASGPSAGDLVLLFFRAGGGFSLASVTEPSGFARDATRTDSGSSDGLLLVSKIATGAEGTTFTFTHTSTTWSIGGMIFSGSASSSVFDKATNADEAGTGTSSQPASLTPTVSGEVLVAAALQTADNGGTEAIDSSFNILDAASLTRLVYGYKIKTDAVAETPTLSWATARGRASLMGAYMPPSTSVLAERQSPRGVLRGALRGTT